MPWSPTPATPQRQYRTAWFPTPPAPEPREHQTAWFPRYRAKPSETGVGQDLAVALPRVPAIDVAMGADRGVVARTGGLLLADGASGADVALVRPKVFVIDGGLATDAARPGVRPIGQGVGSDSGLPRPRLAVVDWSIGADMLTSLRPRIPATDAGRGADSATAGITAHAADTTPFTTVGANNYPIPVWCRYIDIVLIGGGEAGTNGSFATGLGGDEGKWATFTLERGVHIPWTATIITITVGAGGASNGADGGASTAAASGWAGLSAAGGSGGGGIGAWAGNAATNLTYNGVLYPGGAGGATSGGTGGTPGGGGGGGGIFGNGGPGGRGQGWCRAYQ